MDINIGILETDINNYNTSIIQLDLKKKRNDDELNSDIKKINLKDVKLMFLKEFIEYDKVVDEPETNGEQVRTQVSHKKASKCVDTLMSSRVCLRKLRQKLKFTWVH